MLTFTFFISAFLSSSWLIYSLIYINQVLGERNFSELGLQEASGYLALVLLPILIMWMIFGYVHQFFSSKFLQRRTYKLLQQMKKNQDYTDLMLRIMIDAEHEIKDGFILNKFDLFISDMNEMLADLLMRCNLVSSGQMENLWGKVLHGERWSIAKILISSNPTGYNAAEKILEYAKRDAIIAGTLFEFCARYQMLITMLEKHDQEAVFLNIVQTGVMGKAYSILAPVSEELQYGSSPSKSEKFEVSHEKVSEAVIEESKYKPEPRKTLLDIIKSWLPKKKNPYDDLEESEDEFFSALSSESREKKEPVFFAETEEPSFESPSLDEYQQIALDPEENNNEEEQEVSYPFGGWTDEKNYKE